MYKSNKHVFHFLIIYFILSSEISLYLTLVSDVFTNEKI